jgi:hypothetical protein
MATAIAAVENLYLFMCNPQAGWQQSGMSGALRRIARTIQIFQLNCPNRPCFIWNSCPVCDSWDDRMRPD